MRAGERADLILKRIMQSGTPVSGSVLSTEFGVSRQIIVKDIALLKAAGNDIISTARGYIINKPPMPERIFKVVHKDEDIETELSAIVNAGGTVCDVFVWHKIYGKIEARLDIKTLEDVKEYLTSLKNGRSSPLKNVTNHYHYHTVQAASEAVLDKVKEVLNSLEFLVNDED